MTWSHVVILVLLVLLLVMLHVWLDEITKKLRAKKQKEPKE